MMKAKLFPSQKCILRFSPTQTLIPGYGPGTIGTLFSMSVSFMTYSIRHRSMLLLVLFKVKSMTRFVSYDSSLAEAMRDNCYVS